jgi:hypothetical protein
MLQAATAQGCYSPVCARTLAAQNEGERNVAFC